MVIHFIRGHGGFLISAVSLICTVGLMKRNCPEALRSAMASRVVGTPVGVGRAGARYTMFPCSLGLNYLAFVWGIYAPIALRL